LAETMLAAISNARQARRIALTSGPTTRIPSGLSTTGYLSTGTASTPIRAKRFFPLLFWPGCGHRERFDLYRYAASRQDPSELGGRKQNPLLHESSCFMLEDHIVEIERLEIIVLYLGTFPVRDHGI